MSENKNIDLIHRIKRMRYRCWHRGTQEMDLILGNFADVHLPQYNIEQLDKFEKLMGEQDTDLLSWILGQNPIPDNIDAELIAELKDFQLKRSESDE